MAGPALVPPANRSIGAAGAPRKSTMAAPNTETVGKIPVLGLGTWKVSGYGGGSPGHPRETPQIPAGNLPLHPGHLEGRASVRSPLGAWSQPFFPW